MHLIAPDVLIEARGLSVGVSATGTAVGLLLWLFGWRWHRFWTVVGVTVAAGLYGLAAGHPFGGHAVAVGLLLALSAGLLALELARLVAFLAGGTTVWLAAVALFPSGRELGVFFLAGGLAGLLFYRFWTMLVTSFLGVLVAAHAGLLTAESLTKFDAAHWAERYPVGMSVAVGLLALLGVALQVAQARPRVESSPAPPERPRPPADDDLPPDVKALRDAFAKPT